MSNGRRILDEDKRESLSCQGYKVVEVDGFRAYAPNQEYLGVEHSPGEAWGICVDHEEGSEMPETKAPTTEERARQLYNRLSESPSGAYDVAVLTLAIEQAEERGRVEMREKCYGIAEYELAHGDPDLIPERITALPTTD